MAADRTTSGGRPACRAATAAPDDESNVLCLRTRRPPSARPLWLSRHAHACLADGHLVFLDLRSGSYGGLPPHQARAALALMECDDALQAVSLPAARLEPAVVQELLSSGLVTTDPRRGKRLACLDARRAIREAMGTGEETRPRITVRAAWHFLMALAGGALLFHLLPFRAVAWLERRRPSFARRKAVALDEINRVVDLFFFLAPLFYSQQDRCLLNSLVLKRLLRRHGIEARWVFGVAADPFEAHCWLQVGDTVAGDTLMRIWRLTPIMIV